MPSWSGIFQFGTFLGVALCESSRIFTFGPSSSSSNSFPYVTYPFGFSVMFPTFPYFTQKLFCFLVICLLVCLRPFFPNLLVEFFFVVLEHPVLSVFFLKSCLDMFLFFFLSPVSSGLFPRVILFVLLALLYAFRSKLFQRSSSVIIFACCRIIIIITIIHFVNFHVSCWPPSLESKW